jgi:hypothetical protein
MVETKEVIVKCLKGSMGNYSIWFIPASKVTSGSLPGSIRSVMDLFESSKPIVEHIKGHLSSNRFAAVSQCTGAGLVKESRYSAGVVGYYRRVP